jgi:hypothetical protein
MSKNKIEFLIGVLVLLMPFLGFPVGLKGVFYVLLGAALIGLSVSRRVERGTLGIASEKEDERSPKTGV